MQIWLTLVPQKHDKRNVPTDAPSTKVGEAFHERNGHEFEPEHFNTCDAPPFANSLTGAAQPLESKTAGYVWYIPDDVTSMPPHTNSAQPHAVAYRRVEMHAGGGSPHKETRSVSSLLLHTVQLRASPSDALLLRRAAMCLDKECHRCERA